MPWVRDRYEYTEAIVRRIAPRINGLRRAAYDGCGGWEDLIEYAVDIERAKKELGIKRRIRLTDVDCAAICRFLNGEGDGRFNKTNTI